MRRLALEAGDKIMEINIMTPGALLSAERLEGVHFADAVIDALELKVEAAHREGR